MNRGSIWWVRMDPAEGTEIKKTRPAVVVSNPFNNTYLKQVQVVPITSNIGTVEPSESIIMVNGKKSKALAHQIRTVGKHRFGTYIQDVTPGEMARIESALLLQLGFN